MPNCLGNVDTSFFINQFHRSLSSQTPLSSNQKNPMAVMEASCDFEGEVEEVSAHDEQVKRLVEIIRVVTLGISTVNCMYQKTEEEQVC
jgi:hypothetical protein